MNRYDVLNEMATYYEAQARMFSRNCSNVTAKEGYDIPYQDAKDKVALIRGMMNDARYGGGIMEPKQMRDTLNALECCRQEPKLCDQCPLLSQKKRRYNCIAFSKDMAISAISQLLKNRTGENVEYAGRHSQTPQPVPLRQWQVEQMEIDKQREGLL